LIQRLTNHVLSRLAREISCFDLHSGDGASARSPCSAAVTPGRIVSLEGRREDGASSRTGLRPFASRPRRISASRVESPSSLRAESLTVPAPRVQRASACPLRLRSCRPAARVLPVATADRWAESFEDPSRSKPRPVFGGQRGALGRPDDSGQRSASTPRRLNCQI